MTSKVCTVLLGCFLGGCLLLPAAATGANPEQTRSLLAGCLKQEGYLGGFPHGQDLQRGISAYLWDHRYWLVDTGFHRSRDAEALICLLHAKGYSQFADRLKDRNFRDWCERTIKQP